MAKTPDLRTLLEAAAAGKGRRPRGNSVTAAEFQAVAPFATACGALVSGSTYSGYYRALDEENVAESERQAAPPEALPPLA